MSLTRTDDGLRYRFEFDLWDYIHPKAKVAGAQEETLAAWRAVLAEMITPDMLIYTPNGPERSVEAQLAYIYMHNVFSLANLLVRRGKLDKEKIVAAALLLWG